MGVSIVMGDPRKWWVDIGESQSRMEDEQFRTGVPPHFRKPTYGKKSIQ